MQALAVERRDRRVPKGRLGWLCSHGYRHKFGYVYEYKYMRIVYVNCG